MESHHPIMSKLRDPGGQTYTHTHTHKHMKDKCTFSVEEKDVNTSEELPMMINDVLSSYDVNL